MLRRSKRFPILVILLIIASLVLTACGPEAAPADTSGDTQAETPAGQTSSEQETAGQNQPTLAAEPTDTSQPQSADMGKVRSDLGFRPDINGFNFENYGSETKATNLTPAEVERMFGPEVCSRKENGECVLVPAGQQWMEEINAMMADGHCEGFAALSLLMYSGQVKAGDFNGDNAHALSLENQKLQREIAYWWATQATDPTARAVIKGTPSEILKTLQGLSKSSETYTIGIYKRDGSGGHAITPFEVQEDGGGLYSVLVYDNNFPNSTRTLKIDTNQDVWSYEASINPSVESELYEGDASTQTLDLTPTSARISNQSCPFCAQSATSYHAGLAAAAPQYNQVFLEGEGHLLIQDEKGNQLGYVNGQLVNTIPGALAQNWKMQNANGEAPEPQYWLPSGLDVTITIDGTRLKAETQTDLMMIGPGFSIGVEGIGLTPGQKDSVEFMPGDETIVYDTQSSESPTFVIGIEQPGSADYEFDVQGTQMNNGGTITVTLDTKKGDLFVNTEKMTSASQFTLDMIRYTESDEQAFTAEDIALKAGAVVWINYAEWKGNGSGITFNVDTNGDGTVDDEYVVEDSK